MKITEKFSQKNTEENKTHIKGITLIALAITIVALLILAGITVVYVFEDNGVFKKTTNTKIETKLAEIEEQAGIIYLNKFIDKKTGKIDEISNQDIVDELISNGNQIEIRSTGEVSVTGIKVNPETVSIGQSKTAKIKVSLESSDNNNENSYYAVINGKYYKMNFSSSQLAIERKETILEGSIIEQADIEVETGHDTTIVTNVQINQTEKIIKITSGTQYGDTTITVKYGNETATCKITVMDEIDIAWEEIAEMAKAIADDDSITSDSEEATVIVNGESKTIRVGKTYQVKYNGEVRRVRVLGFKHDDLVDTRAYGGKHNKASVSFEFLDFMTREDRIMDPSSTNIGGWENTEMRTFLNGEEGKDKLSNKQYIKQVIKKYIATYDKADSVTTCNDSLWLLAASEVVNNGDKTGHYGYAVTSEGEQYKYYKEQNPIWNSNIPLKYNSASVNEYWWIRSPCYVNNRSFCMIGGGFDYNTAENSRGVAPGFAI